MVRLADLGDLLLAEPAIRSIRAGYPEAGLDLLVTPGATRLARLIAPYTRVIAFDKRAFDNPRMLFRPERLLRLVGLTVRLRRRRYIGVVILHHLTTEIGARKFQALARATGSRLIAGLDNGRGEFLTHRALDLGFGARHEVEYALAVARAAGGAEVDPAPRITHEWSHTALGLPERYIALYPATGAYSSARTWPANSFAEVASVITARGDAIVILGSDDARPAASIIRARCPAAIDLTGATPLEKLVVIVSRARAVVGGDSFIGHLAAALDRPLVTIFGPSNIDAWRPYGSVRVSGTDPVPSARAIALDSGLPCAPCLYTGFRLGRRDGCPSRSCLRMLTPARVIEALDSVLTAENE